MSQRRHGAGRELSELSMYSSSSSRVVYQSTITASHVYLLNERARGPPLKFEVVVQFLPNMFHVLQLCQGTVV